MDLSNPFDFWMSLFLAFCVALIVYGIMLLSVLCWLERRALYRKTRLTRAQKARLARMSTSRALYRKTRLTRSQKARLARKSMRGKVI